jgi:hypothetical protein
MWDHSVFLHKLRFPYISRIQTEILLNAFIFSRKFHSFVQ